MFVGHVIGRDHVAQGFRHLGPVADYHALGEHLAHRLAVCDQTDVAHHLRPEARIDQVQNGVLHAPDVLVNGEPVIDLRGIKRRRGVLRIAVAVEIPAGIDKRIHGVGLTAGRRATLRTIHVDERGNIVERRTPAAGNLNLLRQQHRQLVIRHRHDATRRAVNYRNGSAPVALAGNAPVFQAEGDCRFAETVLFSVSCHGLAGVCAGHAVPPAGVLHNAVVAICLLHRSGVRQRAIHGADHGYNFDAVLVAKLEVTLVVCRNSHDGPGAVAHQHKACGPHRNPLAIEGIDRVQAGIEAVFRHVTRALRSPDVDHAPGLCLQCLAQFCDNLMLQRDNHAGGAAYGVDTRGKHAHRAISFHLKIHFGAFAAANPVALHGQHTIGPQAFQLLYVIQQFIGISGSAQEPLLQRALLHRSTFMTPAATIHYLFIGQHGSALWAPVHQRLFAVGQPFFQHAQEEPLVPAVVLGIAGGHFPIPVIGESKAAMGALHFLYVGKRPFARRALVGYGGIFRRQTERVPTHGVQHVVAAHPHVTR